MLAAARELLRVIRREPPAWWLNSHTMQLADARLSRSLDRGHFAFIGSTRSGKSTLLTVLLASLLRHIPDELDVFNCFCFDPQNDLYPFLVGMDLPLKVILTNVLDSRGWAWNMHDDVRDPASAWQFAYSALPDDKNANDNKFYSDAPRHIFAAVLRELVNRRIPWTLRKAYLLAMDERLAEELCRTSGDPGVRRVIRLFAEGQGATKANIDSSLLTKLANLETYAALMEHARNRFSLRGLVGSDVVAVAGGDFQFNHVVGPMNYLMLTCLKHRLVGQRQSRERRHYVFCDEFSGLNHEKPADEILDLFVRGASRGVRVCIAVHSPQQLKAVYGEHTTDVILGQCQNKIVLKVADEAGARYCAGLLGHVHGYKWTRSFGRSYQGGVNPSSGSSEGVQETYVDRTLVHFSDVMDLPLASFEHGIHGFAVVPNFLGTRRWRFHLSPGWLAEHAVREDETVPSYEECRRPGRHQRLLSLTRTEVEELGLTYHGDE